MCPNQAPSTLSIPPSFSVGLYLILFRHVIGFDPVRIFFFLPKSIEANENTCKLELMKDRFYIVLSIDKNCSMWFMHLDMNRKQREVWTHAYKWAEAI